MIKKHKIAIMSTAILALFFVAAPSRAYFSNLELNGDTITGLYQITAAETDDPYCAPEYVGFGTTIKNQYNNTLFSWPSGQPIGYLGNGIVAVNFTVTGEPPITLNSVCVHCNGDNSPCKTLTINPTPLNDLLSAPRGAALVLITAIHNATAGLSNILVYFFSAWWPFLLVFSIVTAYGIYVNRKVKV